MYNNDSYKSHEKNIIRMIEDTDFESFQRYYFEKGYTTSWLINIFNKNLDPLINSDPGTSWLTIGDGRYGSDAHYLLQKGLEVIATDISDAALKIGFDKGFINQFRKENAERLSFLDKEFDYCLCKEALHHFPRPFQAIYEMLRVSRKGIVLIEPIDMYIFSTSRQIIFRYFIEKFSQFTIFRKFLKEIKRHTYEEAGNYVYKISRREIEKIALGLNLHFVAFKEFNISTECYNSESDHNPEERIGINAPNYKKIKRKTNLFNLLTWLKLSQPTNISVIIFITPPSKETIAALKNDLYDVIELPENPYAVLKE